MHSVSRSLLVAGIVALGGLTACGDKLEITNPTVTPGNTGVTDVRIVPTQATLGINQQQQFTATVIGGSAVTDFGVTWSSTDATVASVDANGMVKALKAGSTNIIATSKANTNFRAVAPVVVTPDQPFSVNFQGLFGANGAAANIDSIAGQLTARFNVQQGTGAQRIDSVQVVMNCGTTQTVVYTQRYTSGTPGGVVEATWNTAAFNPTTGAPLYANANGCTVLARGFAGGSNVASVATPSTTINLKNLDVLRAYVTTDGKQASDTGAKLWNSGAVTVRMLPTVYSGQTIASYSVTLRGTDVAAGTHAAPAGAAYAQTKTITGSTGTATFALSGAGNVNAQTFPNATVAFNAIGSNGAAVAFPTNQTIYPVENNQAFFRLDNEAPTAPASATTSLRNGGLNWLGAGYAFSTTGGTANVMSGAGSIAAATRDEGVNTEAYTIYAGQASSYTGLGAGGALGNATGASCTTTGLTPVTSTNQLASTTVSTGYQIRAVATDALGNASCVDVTTTAGQASFGVDPVAPTASFIAPADQSVVTAATNITITTRDSLSGFASNATRLRTYVVRNDSLNTAANCIVGTAPTATTPCTYTTSDTAISLAGIGATEAYYRVNSYAQDIAGNQSTPVLSRLYIADVTAPVVTSVTQAAAVPALGTVSGNVSATDNLDLNQGSVRLQYLTANPVRFQGSTAQLGSFGLPLETTGSFTSTAAPALVSVTELSSLTNGVAAGGATTGSLLGRVTVQAGLVGPASAGALTFTAGTAAPATPAISGACAVTACNASVTRTNGTAPATNLAAGASQTLEFRVTVPGTVVDQPFSSVGLYSYSTTTGVMTLVGTATTTGSVALDANGNRVYIYTLTETIPAGSASASTQNFRVLAIASNGNALVTPVLTNTVP
jgi:hypothetical protein